MNIEKNTGENKIAEVRSKFDVILVKEITRLIEINDESIQAISFNMVTLSCLFLLVERENEIKKISDNSIERYTESSLLKEVIEVTGSGQTIDDNIDKDLLEAFEKLAEIGYVNIKKDRYYLQLPAFAVVNFINSLFPDMSGMNLVAFVNQMVDEVLTNRKSIDDGLEQFQVTLETRGVALHNQEKKNFNKPADDLKLPVQDEVDKKKQKNKLAKQISSLRSIVKKKTGVPNIITSSYSRKVKIKAVFDKKEYQEDIEQPVQKHKTEQSEQKKDVSVHENEEKKSEAENLINHDNVLSSDMTEEMADLSKDETMINSESEETGTGDLNIAENISTTAVKKESGADVQKQIKDEVARLVSEELKKQEIEKNVESKEIAEKTFDDKDHKTDIENKIKMFENSMSIVCPVCNQGKISSETTESEKEYYSCSNEHCSFISWGKPYPYKCPICQNPFLIESLHDPLKPPGLKCPRAMCPYSQKNTNPPLETPLPETSVKPKKKVRRVRRVRKKS